MWLKLDRLGSEFLLWHRGRQLYILRGERPHAESTSLKMLCLLLHQLALRHHPIWFIFPTFLTQHRQRLGFIIFWTFSKLLEQEDFSRAWNLFSGTKPSFARSHSGAFPENSRAVKGKLWTGVPRCFEGVELTPLSLLENPPHSVAHPWMRGWVSAAAVNRTLRGHHVSVLASAYLPAWPSAPLCLGVNHFLGGCYSLGSNCTLPTLGFWSTVRGDLYQLQLHHHWWDRVTFDSTPYFPRVDTCRYSAPLTFLSTVERFISFWQEFHPNTTLPLPGHVLTQMGKQEGLAGQNGHFSVCANSSLTSFQVSCSVCLRKVKEIGF